MLWNKLLVKQNWIINLQIYESSVITFTCLANWLDMLSICHVKSTFIQALAKTKSLCGPSYKLIGGKQGKRFSCIFPLGEYVITRLSKKCSALFFPTHFTWEWKNNKKNNYSTNIATAVFAFRWDCFYYSGRRLVSIFVKQEALILSFTSNFFLNADFHSA